MSGLGSFLNGVVDGVERRRRWDRQDKQDKWTEEHQDYTRYERGQQKDADTREAAARKAAADAYQATVDAFDGTAADAAPENAGSNKRDSQAPVSVSTRSAPNTPTAPGKSGAGAPRRLTLPGVEQMPVPQTGQQLRYPSMPSNAQPEAAQSGPAALPAPQADAAPQPPRRSMPAPVRAGQGQPPAIGQRDQLPALDNNQPNRFQQAAQKVQGKNLTPQLAVEADRAEAALMAGVNPQTGAALNEYEQQQLAQVVQAAEERLAMDASRTPAPPAPAGSPGMSEGLQTQMADQQAMAAQALQTGVHPVTGQPLSNYERQQAQQIAGSPRRGIPTPMQNTGPDVAPMIQGAAQANDTAQAQARAMPQGGPQAPQARSGPAPLQSAPAQPAAPGLDAAPTAGPAAPNAQRFTRAAINNPDGALTMDIARAAEIAERALQSGTNPQTGKPLDEYETQQAQQIIAAATERMEMDARRAAPAPQQASAPAPGPQAPPRRAMPGPGPQQAAPPTPSMVTAPPAAPGSTSAAPAPARQPGQAPGPTPAQASATGDPTALDAAVTQTQGQPSPPSVTDAAAAATKATRNLPVSTAPAAVVAKRQKRASGDFLTNYAKVGAPKMIEFYMKAGEPEKAIAYQQFIERTETKAAMGHWADAVFAATIGDDNRFLDNLTDAYNARGYFDDGFEAVREKSGILRDADGNVNGAQITFRDTNTGREFTQTLDSSQDLYQLGVHMLAPEQVFEHGWGRIKAAEERRAALLTLANREKTTLTKSDEERITKAMEMLAEADISFGQLPVDEQLAQAWAYVQRFDSAGGLKGPTTAPASQPASQQGGAREVPRY